MKSFKLFIVIIQSTLLAVLSGCLSAENKSINQEDSTCPKCHMEIPKSHIHTATITRNKKVYSFDDIGCMILWCSQNSINLPKVEPKVFTNDTKKYIDAFKAHYKINEKTPMSYGFSAYENQREGTIDFEEVILRMLRGEHMANPKIRKQILGL